MDSTKAVTFKLLSVTKTKMNRLQRMADEFKRVYNFAAKRLPSFQKINQSKSRMPMEAIRKDVCSSLHSQITQEAIEYTRSNYCTIVQTNNHSVPILVSDIIRIHNQAWEFKIKNERYYLVFPIEKIGNRYTKMWLPIKINDYLENLIKTTKFGVGQINLKNQTFTTSYKIIHESKNYIPETFIGIDLGLNNLAVMVVLDSDKKFLESKFWNGKEVQHIRRLFYNYRKSVQKIGRMDCNKKSKGYESNWMKNINHNISREIVEIAKKYPNPIIIMEDLHRFKNGKIQWNFYQLREMIRYKTELDNIRFKLVVPKGTSQMCNKCGHVSPENRNGIKFICEKCGYSIHADFNAAVNIAKKYLNHSIHNM